jgi:hypothetical protein
MVPEHVSPWRPVPDDELVAVPPARALGYPLRAVGHLEPERVLEMVTA